MQISNALKQDFPSFLSGDPTITVRLHRSADGTIEMGVGDNGIGLPDDLENRKNESLGLSLAGILVNQIKGVIDTHVDGGTTYTVRFQEKKTLK